MADSGIRALDGFHQRTKMRASSTDALRKADKYHQHKESIHRAIDAF